MPDDLSQIWLRTIQSPKKADRGRETLKKTCGCVHRYNEHRILPYKIHRASLGSVISTPLPGVDISKKEGMYLKDNPKTARLELRPSEAEKTKIVRKARRCGMSITDYVLHCCLDGAAREKPPDEFWQLLNGLYAIAPSLPPEKQKELEKLVLALQEAV